jgi:hypothetical protein
MKTFETAAENSLPFGLKTKLPLSIEQKVAADEVIGSLLKSLGSDDLNYSDVDSNLQINLGDVVDRDQLLAGLNPSVLSEADQEILRQRLEDLRSSIELASKQAA